MKPHFAMFARYNEWANRRLYDCAAALSDADYRADRGAFFGSVHGTLNHLLVGRPHLDEALHRRGPRPISASIRFCSRSLRSCAAAREAEDARIIDWIDALDDAKLAGTFTYRTIVNPTDITQPLAPALAHFFNHQTHHRGQAHALLTAIGGRDAAPSLDLILFQRETGIGLSA